MYFIKNINLLKDIEKHKKQRLCAGFTLVETIIAIFILTIGILTIYGVFFDMSRQAKNQSNSLIASYLAQEGIEIVKNMRDTNWITNYAGYWLEGIDNGSCLGGCNFEADFKTGTPYQIIELRPYGTDGNFLNIDDSNVYSYNPDYPETIFKRKITITGPLKVYSSDDYFSSLKVSALVMWNYKGDDYSVQMEEFIYNWY